MCGYPASYRHVSTVEQSGDEDEDEDESGVYENFADPAYCATAVAGASIHGKGALLGDSTADPVDSDAMRGECHYSDELENDDDDEEEAGTGTLTIPVAVHAFASQTAAVVEVL
jgi:hypothetical protein